LIFASPLKGDLDIYDLAYESDGQYAPFVCRAMAVKDKGRKVLGWPHKSLLKWIGRKGITVKDTFEVGCGDAHFVYFLNSLGYNATGCDISSSACRRAKEIFGLDIIHGE
jgi:SAM-dependent methyltransferase